MTWSDFQSGIYSLTEKEVNDIVKKVLAVYRDALASINSLIKEAYAKNLTGIAPGDYYNEMLKRGRLEKLKAEISAEYLAYSRKAQSLVEHALSISASNSYYRSIYSLSWLNNNVYNPIPYSMVELMVYGSEAEWKAIPVKLAEKYAGLENYISKAGTLSEMIISNRQYELDQIQRTISSGLLQGASYPQMSSGIKNVIGAVVKNTNGTISTSGAMANAMKIVRTESNRVMNAANYAAQITAEDEGLEVGKQWIATHDSRTRPEHARMENIGVVPLDYVYHIGQDAAKFPGGFGMIKNVVHCRCSTVTTVDGELPKARRGRDPQTGKNEVYAWSTFDEWAKEKGLTKNVYGEIYEQ